MSDNRFAYMRKHLGISQKDASEMFNTRLDTIKKWDNGRLFVPMPVLEELYELVSDTKWLIEECAGEYNARDEDEPIDEIFLHVPERNDLESLGLPPSVGWVENVIGAIIGTVSGIHVYAASKIPDHYEVDFQWYELWEERSSKTFGDLFIDDEQAFVRRMEKKTKYEQFDVRFDAESTDYYLGFPATTLDKRSVTIWIKACSGGLTADWDVFSKDELKFHSSGDKGELPFVEGEHGPRSVGLKMPDTSIPEEQQSDVFSLAELIFETLRKTYPTNGDMLNACRRIHKSQWGDPDDDVQLRLPEWKLNDKYGFTHNFLVSLFLAVERDTKLYLYPEALNEFCDIVRRSEPVKHGIDKQSLIIENDSLEVSILLDLRDIIEAKDKTSDNYAREFEKAIEILKASVSGCEVACRPAFSQISAVVLEDADAD